jgi:lipopolysaccharide assembly outer membrane protein LptD (OstA)
MRKILVVALVIVGAAITGDAQVGPKGNLPRGVNVTAGRTDTSKGDILFSRNVSISIAGGKVTADRAIMRQGSNTLELEGHVQLKVNPPVKWSR